ncbi:T9SS type A sorting domain-containing protein [Aquimarina sp. 2201CG14-23]|uniref:T9SS type A sorting domain-containing protein n=1 Tax=Aquimarina mycalae TaxID=3040073 RepID=UPI0024781279|nr:T9SS type A sorting domain-containing protein [Aquimarina sp. 2201CG14-23]MDH7445151.1 T9SS type A sorting domain-containing protein [Aquimarina sp. 2201CG14-23]
MDSNASCNGDTDGQITGSGTGGTMPYTYQWSNGATTASTTGLAAGTYTITITDANGCTDDASTSVTEPTAVVAAALVDSNASCNGDTDGQITGSGAGGTMPYTYSWSNGATTASTTGLAAGTYTITITDANGCTDDASTTVTEPTAVVAAALVDSNASCNGDTDGQITGSGTGGTMPYTYSWSNGATTASTTGLAAGTYTVTITDANGCTDDASTSVTEPTAVVAAALVDSNASCNGDTDGQITGSGAGGTMPYTYSWSNGATTASTAGLSAGTYTITITDANGCTDEESTTVTEPAALVAATVVDANQTPGASDGAATGSASGGTMPYTYLWSNGGTTASITGLTAGTYTVSVTDNNGCGPDTSEATIIEDPLLSIDDLTDQIVVNIYPNPVRDHITLSFDKNTQAQIQIIDLLGKVITTEKVNSQIINMSVSHLTSGIYFVKIEDNQNTGIYRIIKE